MGGGEFVKTEDASASQVTLDVRTEYSQLSGLGAHELTVMARLKAPQEADDDGRAPVSICAVIDRSESMKDHIGLVRETLSFVVQQLRPEDQLSLVTFDNQVKTELPLEAMTLAGKEHAQAAIRRLKERGQTNLSGGLLAGLQQLMFSKPPEGGRARVESVLLFTDGRANIGIRDTPTITKATRSVVQQIGRNVCVFTFGFGPDHDAEMLRSIADAGNGLYYYINDVDSIPESFGDCLGGLLSVAAQNLCLEVTAIGDQTVAQPQITGYQVKSLEANKKFSVTIPDIYSEEEKDVLFRVFIPADKTGDKTEPFAIELAQCQLRYFDVLTCQVETLEAKAVVRICPVEELATAPRPGTADVDVALQRFRLLTAKTLSDAQQLADSSRYQEARATLNQCIQSLEASAVADHELVKHLIETLQSSLDGLKDKVTYVSRGKAVMTNHCHSHFQQRSNWTSPSFTSPMYPQATKYPAAACALSSADVGESDKLFKNPYRGKKKMKVMSDIRKTCSPRREEE